jgi:hypothetical protein
MSAQVTTIATEFAGGRGIAEIRSMDFDIALSIDVEAEEPVNPVKDPMMVLMSVSLGAVSFQHMLDESVTTAWESIRRSVAAQELLNEFPLQDGLPWLTVTVSRCE